MSATELFSKAPFFFNQTRFVEDLDKASTREDTIECYRSALSALDFQHESRLDQGENAGLLVRERALFVDMLLHHIWRSFEWSKDAALLAVGGYGRGELHPRSDVDLMLLFRQNPQAEQEDTIRDFLTFLWDIGLEIGSSVRSVKDCLKLAAKDITIATSVLECRTLMGDTRLEQNLRKGFDKARFWPNRKFFDAKMQEQRERHEKHNNTEYNLEPNIKNAPGGLRDIQTIKWIAKRVYRINRLFQLYGQEVFTEEEFSQLEQCESFMWRVRYHLHLLVGKPEERLLFDYQKQLAERLGYKDSDLCRAVEAFMHDYYRTATTIIDLNSILLQFIDEEIDDRKIRHTEVINEQLSVENGYLQIVNDDVFTTSPKTLLEIFLVLGQRPDIKGIRAATSRKIREHRFLIDKSYREKPENKKLFVEILKTEEGLVTQLRRMKRYGILGAYLPAFEDIIGQMQFDLFHRYTVDAHTLNVIKNVCQFANPDQWDRFPIASMIVRNLDRPILLTLAALFHDIGKGRGGDHSELGSVDAIEFCRDHYFSEREGAIVAWLVTNHLVMSYVSQKQDISDPEVINQFAQRVGDQYHLDLLYSLTVADMCGTNPELYNDWRASLLRQLYLDTKRALHRGLEAPIDKNELIEEKKFHALTQLVERGVDLSQVEDIWGMMDEDYFVKETIDDIAQQTKMRIDHRGQDTIVRVENAEKYGLSGATQIFVRVKDRPNVFAAVSHALARLNLSIQDARLYITSKGYCVSNFYVLNSKNKPIKDAPESYEKVVTAIQKELSYLDNYDKVIARRVTRQLKQFAEPTTVEVTNSDDLSHTELKLVTPDRQGLLANIGRVFSKHKLYVRNAKILTLGDRVEDIFYLEQHDGHKLTDSKAIEALRDELCSSLDSFVKQTHVAI